MMPDLSTKSGGIGMSQETKDAGEVKVEGNGEGKGSVGPPHSQFMVRKDGSLRSDEEYTAMQYLTRRRCCNPTFAVNRYWWNTTYSRWRKTGRYIYWNASSDEGSPTRRRCSKPLPIGLDGPLVRIPVVFTMYGHYRKGEHLESSTFWTKDFGTKHCTIGPKKLKFNIRENFLIGYLI